MDVEEYICEFGCKEGACLKEQVTQNCEDEDGLNYYIKGNARQNSLMDFLSDECHIPSKDEFIADCRDNDCSIFEYYCKDNLLEAEEFHCEYGCKDGACILSIIERISKIKNKQDKEITGNLKIVIEKREGDKWNLITKLYDNAITLKSQETKSLADLPLDEYYAKEEGEYRVNTEFKDIKVGDKAVSDVFNAEKNFKVSGRVMANRQVSQKPIIELIPEQNYLKENDKIIFASGETEKKVKIKFKITDDKPIPPVKEGFSIGAYIIYDLSNSGNLIQNPKPLDCPYVQDSGNKEIICEDEFVLKNNVGPKLRLSLFAQDSDNNKVEKRVEFEVEKDVINQPTLSLKLVTPEVSLNREFFYVELYLEGMPQESQCFQIINIPMLIDNEYVKVAWAFGGDDITSLYYSQTSNTLQVKRPNLKVITNGKLAQIKFKAKKTGNTQIKLGKEISPSSSGKCTLSKEFLLKNHLDINIVEHKFDKKIINLMVAGITPKDITPPDYASKDYFNQLVFGQKDLLDSKDNNRYSVRNFYDFSSYGDISIEGEFIKGKNIDWIILPNDLNYYINHKSKWGFPDGDDEMLRDFVTIMDSEIDFSQFDRDKNGHVDQIILFVPPLVSRQLNTRGGNYASYYTMPLLEYPPPLNPSIFDGVNIDNTLLIEIPELITNDKYKDNNVGIMYHTLIHELAHQLPIGWYGRQFDIAKNIGDLYHGEINLYGSHVDLMAGEVGFSGYTKYKVKLLDSEEILEIPWGDTKEIRLYKTEEEPPYTNNLKLIKIIPDNKNPDRYYLIEWRNKLPFTNPNRYNFDKSLDYEGLFIYKADDSKDRGFENEESWIDTDVNPVWMINSDNPNPYMGYKYDIRKCDEIKCPNHIPKPFSISIGKPIYESKEEGIKIGILNEASDKSYVDLKISFDDSVTYRDLIPKIVFVRPSVGTTYNQESGIHENAKADKVVKVRFSEAMDEQTLKNTFKFVKIVDDKEEKVNGELSFALWELWYNLEMPLEPNTLYKVILTKEAKDSAGNSLEEDFVYVFKTRSQ